MLQVLSDPYPILSYPIIPHFLLIAISVSPGRSFILGKKFDTHVKTTEVDNGAVWIHLRNADRKHFGGDGNLHPFILSSRIDQQTINHPFLLSNIIDFEYHPAYSQTTRYYSTQQVFGYSHWVWLIPTSRSKETDVSVGLTYYRPAIKSQDVNSQEKLLAFLKSNHTWIYNLVKR